MFMDPYHKINALYKRDDTGKLLIPQPDADEHEHYWARPEFRLLSNVPWIWTEKVDGTNIRLGYEPGQTHIHGRTNKAQIPEHLYTELLKLLEQIPWEEHFDCPVTLYGEGYGPKIQKGGGLYRDTPGFVLFDVQIGGYWLDRENVEEVAQKLGVDVVPVRTVANIRSAELAVSSTEFKSAWGDFTPEGLVGTPLIPLYDKRGHRIICKVKVKDYRQTT